MGSCTSKMDVFGCCLHTLPSPEPTPEQETEPLLRPPVGIHAERYEHIIKEPEAQGRKHSPKKKHETLAQSSDQAAGQNRVSSFGKETNERKTSNNREEIERTKQEKNTLVRLFVAVELTEQFKQAAQESMSDLQADPQIIAAGRALRWVRSEGLHVTLKFLGEVEAERVEGISDALREAIENCGQVRFLLRGLGMGLFPEAKKGQQPIPRVLWVGLGPECQKPLERLHSAVDLALMGQGFQPAKGSFNSHITLARIDAGKRHNSKNRKPKRKIDLTSGEEQASSTTETQTGTTSMELDESTVEISEKVPPENGQKKWKEEGGKQTAFKDLWRVVERIQSYSVKDEDVLPADPNSQGMQSTDEVQREIKPDPSGVMLSENDASMTIKGGNIGLKSNQNISGDMVLCDEDTKQECETEAKERWQGRWERMAMCVTKISLMRSELGRGGARYTALDTFELPTSCLSVLD